MEILINLLFVLATSAAIGTVFAIALRGRGPWPGLLWFFIVLIVGTWALGIWVRPIGPPWWSVQWVPYAIAAAMIALLLAAATPPLPAATADAKPEASREAPVPSATDARSFNVAFWLLLGLCVLSIVMHYAAITP
jgi:hypothetical protein